jgi:glycosyltransferase involved in cell wall biosynthesis
MASSGGGLEQYLSQIFVELDQRGHQSLLLYGESGKDSAPLLSAKTFLIENITHSTCKDTKKKLKLVQDILCREKPDLVFIHQVLNPPLVDLLTKEKPSVRFVHGFKLICPEGRKTLKTKGVLCQFPLSYLCQSRASLYKCMPRNPFIGLRLIHDAKAISHIHRQRSYMVVASDFMKSVLLHNGFKEDKITVIPIFTYLPELNSVSSHSNDPIILSVGRIYPDKGMDYLLRAFAALKERARMIIVGDGPALKELKSLSDRLGISSKVSYTGWIAHDKLSRLYRQCSLVVVPSIWPEPFGMVGIEALGYQKPVVAFDTGGISEWLKDGKTGLMVLPRNESDLADKISFLLERPNMSKQLGHEGRQLVEKRFNPECHLGSLLDLFKEAIRNQDQN